MNLACAVIPPSYDLYEVDRTHSTSWRPRRGYSIQFVGDFSPLPPLPPQPIESPPGTHLDLNYSELFGGLPRVLNLGIDGTLVQRCAMEVNIAEANRLPEVLFQDFPIGEATIDFRADGSVVGYAGRPGRNLSEPRVLRPPSYSFLEMRWPIHRQRQSLTLVFLVLTVRRLNPRQIRMLFIVVTLSSINLAGAFACQGMEQPRLLSSTWGHVGAGEEYYSDGSRHITEMGARDSLARDSDQAAEPAANVPANLVADHDQHRHHAPGPRHFGAACPAAIDRGGGYYQIPVRVRVHQPTLSDSPEILSCLPDVLG